MINTLEEIRYKGVPISGGIAIGKLLILLCDQDELIPEFTIPISAVDSEIARYRRAITSSRNDLHDLQNFLTQEGSTEAVTIIDAHIQMLDDPIMTTFVEEKIRLMLKNTESVFQSIVGDYENKFNKLSEQFFKQRLLDVKDLSKRIMRNLHPNMKKSIEKVIPEQSVVFSKELDPSNVAAAVNNQIIAFVTNTGGATSHAAIIAQAKGVPYVIADINLDEFTKKDDLIVIVDGKSGDVIVSPTEETLSKYRVLKHKVSNEYMRFVSEGPRDVETTDGCKIEVLANIEQLEDLPLVHQYNAAGIGLFRSEFLIPQDYFQFQEEDQFQQYKQVLEKADGLPVVLRVFDIGGDKGKNSLFTDGQNPALGCRAIRLLLSNRKIFQRQLRALLRSSTYGDLRILIPLISDVNELIETKELIKNLRVDLDQEGHRVAKKILIGSMIEVPSAALTVDIIAKESDFLSLGTNDLIQYTLAVDRLDQNVHTYKSTHLSVLRLIKRVIIEAQKQRIPLGICGEVASNPYLTVLLLGMGIRQFSCVPKNIPIVKNMISRVSLEEAKCFAYDVSKFSDSEKIYEQLVERYKQIESMPY